MIGCRSSALGAVLEMLALELARVGLRCKRDMDSLACLCEVAILQLVSMLAFDKAISVAPLASYSSHYSWLVAEPNFVPLVQMELSRLVRFQELSLSFWVRFRLGLQSALLM